jgi:histidine triad (HIT) family protein
MEIEKLKTKLLDEINKLPKEQADVLREKISNMTVEELQKFIKESSIQCFFCQIIAGKIETIKIYESPNIMAILDINPANPGHMLLMPKEHYQFITDLPEEILYEVFYFVKHISPVLLEVLNAKGIDIYIAQGISQRVPHFMVNIIPRFENDNLDINWERKKIPKEELENIATEIRAKAKSAVKEIERKGVEKEKQKSEKKSEEEKEIEAMLRFYKDRIP